MTKVAYIKTSPGARKMFVEKVIHSYKVIDPESEIIKTGQGERIMIYLIPSVPPRKRNIREIFTF